MGRKYVLETARIGCEYGTKMSRLGTLAHRHITSESAKRLANETDFTLECIESFGECKSCYIDTVEKCVPEIVIPWQGTKENVNFGKYKALLENGWTVCSKGFGIITLLSSGREADVMLQCVAEKLEELMAVINQYVIQKQISSKYKDGLLKSILFPEGKETELEEKFQVYLKDTKPELKSFFEGRLFIRDSRGEKVDFTYMMEIYQELEERWNVSTKYIGLITEEMLADEAMFNAYISACKQQSGQTFSGMLTEYMKHEQRLSEQENPFRREQDEHYKQLEKIEQIIEAEYILKKFRTKPEPEYTFDFKEVMKYGTTKIPESEKSSVISEVLINAFMEKLHKKMEKE